MSSLEIENMQKLKQSEKAKLDASQSDPFWLDQNNIKIINEHIHKQFDKVQSDEKQKKEQENVWAAPGQQILEYDFREGVIDHNPHLVNDRILMTRDSLLDEEEKILLEHLHGNKETLFT